MPRRVQDIVPNKHRSIRDIPVERESLVRPKSKEASRTRTQPVEMRPTKNPLENVEVRIEKTIVNPPVTRRPRKSGSKKWLYIVMGIVIIVAGAAYVASVYFSYASFKVAPKVVSISVNSTYVTQGTPEKSVLAYEIAAVKGGSSVTVPATDGPKISTSAKGKITLYNAYSKETQRLIAGTRLSDDTGRIYRLTSSVVIPGFTTSGGNTIPGTLVTIVSADQPGDKYNILKTDSVSDFKIVAYKDTSKYNSMYGRLAGDISGGFVGTQKVISTAMLASTTRELENKVTASLLTQVKAAIPNGYIMYPNAYVATFSTPTVNTIDAKSASVTVQGNLSRIIFKKNELVLRIAGDKAVETFDGFAYEAKGLEDLDFSITNLKDFSPEKKNSLIIKLKGDAKLMGVIPVDSLKKKLAGLSLTETESVFRSYKPVIDIDKSSGEITPPWSKVPMDPSRI